MNSLTYVLVAGAMFSLGMLYAEATKPQPLPYRIVRPEVQPAVLLIPCNQSGIEEYHRTCRARKRSATVGPT